MQSYRTLRAVSIGVLLSGSVVFAQERVVQEREVESGISREAEPQPEVFEFADPRHALGATTEIHLDEGTVEALATPTPAADVSAGTFGLNVGGGTYNFPARVGFGTTTPISRLHMVNDNFIQEAVLNSPGAFGSMFFKARGTVGAKSIVQNGDTIGIFRFMGWDGSAYQQAAGIAGVSDGTPGPADMPGRLVFYTVSDGSAGIVERMRITSTGYVGIGTTAPAQRLHVNGNAFVSGTLTGGNIQAHYQDIAEWVPAGSEMEPGTVVVLNRTRSNEVVPSSSAYDTAVAGVVSEQPGLTLGVADDSKEMIATTGRVRIRVDGSAGPIRVGDLLVTSDVPGHAMKSVPLEIGGQPFHRPGTIIGKALEDFDGQRGTILVLLSMQ